MADNAVICPVCGTLRAQAPQPRAEGYATQQEANPPYEYYQQNNPRGYQEGYAPPLPQPNQQSYHGYPPPPQQPNYGYAPPYTGYAVPNINVTVINNAPTSSGSNDGALVAEILLSLLGIFGVGWLIAGETTTGVILLVCSIFLYWPIMFFGTLVTGGAGLLCLGPLMIAAIITNALLLNNAIKRKGTPFVFVQQPPMQMPQQMPPQQPPPMNMPPQR